MTTLSTPTDTSWCSCSTTSTSLMEAEWPLRLPMDLAEKGFHSMMCRSMPQLAMNLYPGLKSKL